MKIITSKKFRLNLRDYAKGLLMAAGTSAGVVIQNVIDAGDFIHLKWKPILMAAIGGGLTYLIKNFLSPSKVIIKSEPPVTVTATTPEETITKETEVK